MPWLCFCRCCVFAQASVTTQHNDAARTGANLSETVLTTTNVNVSQFGKLFERAVDDEIYVQPLYVEGVNIPGVGIRNVVYVATNNDSVYAFDADDPAASAPLWRINYTNPAAGIVPVSRTDVGQACGTYVDFAGNIGIVGTPVIDPVSQTMYFVTRTKENGTFVQRLHAVDIRDGSERLGSPLVIQASVVGTGDGRDAQNNIAFNARTQNQRAGAPARSRHRLHHVGVVLRPGSVPRLDPRLRRRDLAAGHGLQHHARRRPGRHLAVRRRPVGRCRRQPVRADGKRFVQRRHRQGGTSGTASSR